MGLRTISDTAVETEVKRIGSMNKNELRSLWQNVFKAAPPKSFGPDLLRRSLAYKVQEAAYGGLTGGLKRELADAVRQVLKRPSSRIELPRRIMSGAVLIREWKGKVVRVTVLEDGFLFEDRNYSSLSEIAKLITGTNWNGPRFFGLRRPDKPNPSKSGGGEPVKRPRRRPRKAVPDPAANAQEHQV